MAVSHDESLRRTSAAGKPCARVEEESWKERMERVDRKRIYRVARSAEVAYAAIQGGMAYYISLRLDGIGHPLPRSIFLLAAGVPVAVALTLAIVLRPSVRWAWWPAVALALYVIVDAAATLVRVADLPARSWPSNAWVGFAAIGARFFAQLLVVGAAVVVLWRPSLAASPPG